MNKIYKSFLIAAMFLLSFSGFSQTTFYAVNDGDWNSYDNWTTDKSAIIFVNEAKAYPQAGDIAVINGGRTITMKGNVKVAGLVLMGDLITQGKILTADKAEGTGRIVLNKMTDVVIAKNDFFTNGTIAIKSTTDITQTSVGSLEIFGTARVTGDISIKNDLIVREKGTLTLGTEKALFVCTVGGNVLVENGGTLLASKIPASVRNQYSTQGKKQFSSVIVYGNFVNRGTVKFASAPGKPGRPYRYWMSQQDNLAEIEFVGDRNSEFLAYNTTDVLRYVCNKTSTATLFVTAADKTCLATWGKVTDLDGSYEELPVVLKSGTLKLGENIAIDAWGCSRTKNGDPYSHYMNLTTRKQVDLKNGPISASDYRIQRDNGMYIPYGATLWIAGATVNAGQGTAIRGAANGQGTAMYGNVCVMGELKISAGSLTLPNYSTGIYYSDPDGLYANKPAKITIEGGTINTSRIASLDGRKLLFNQTGGTLNFNKTINQGKSVYTDKVTQQPCVIEGGCTFDMQNGGEFVMTAGNMNFSTIDSNDPVISLNTMDIRAAGSISGGNITFNNTSGKEYKVYAPYLTYNNVNVKGTSEVTIQGNTGGTAGVGFNDVAVVVKKNLTVDAKAKFNATYQLQVNGNLTIGKDGLISSCNKTVGMPSLVFGGALNSEYKDESKNNFFSVTVKKDKPTYTTTISKNPLLINRDLNAYNGSLIGNVTLNIDNTLVCNQNSKNVTQTISTNDGGDLSQVNVTTQGSGDVFIGNSLTLRSIAVTSDRLIKLGNSNLNLLTIPTAAWSANRMFVGSGVIAAGGLTLPVNVAKNGSVLFPIGTSTGYSPCTVTVNSAANGSMTIVPVNDYHPAISGDALGSIKISQALKYYWRTTWNGSNVSNKVFQYDFTSPIALATSNWFKISDGYYFINNTWGTDNSSTNKDKRQITFKSLTSPNGDFTEGFDLTGILDKVKKYYSYQDGDWHNSSTWTTNADFSKSNNKSVPNYNDIVIIGNGKTVTIAKNEAQAAAAIIDSTGTLIVKSNTTKHNVNSIEGNGTLIYEVACENDWNTKIENTNYLNGLHNKFCSNGASRFVFKNVLTNYKKFVMPSAITEYPNLRIEGKVESNQNTVKDESLTINGNLTVAENSQLTLSGANTESTEIQVNGTTTIETGATLTTSNATGLKTSFKGDVVNKGTFNKSTGPVDLYKNLNQNGVCNFVGKLSFVGSETSVVSGNEITFEESNNSVTRLCVDKDVATNEVKITSLLKSKNGDATSTLYNELITGKLTYSNSANDINLVSYYSEVTGNGSGVTGKLSYFYIPSDFTLIADGGSKLNFVASDVAGIKLDGALNITGGAKVFVSNGIGYTASGKSSLSIGDKGVLSASQIAPYGDGGTVTFRLQNANASVTFGNDGKYNSRYGILDIRGGSFTQVVNSVVNIIKATTDEENTPAFRFTPDNAVLNTNSKFVLDTKAKTGIYSTVGLKGMEIAEGTQAFIHSYPLTFSSKLLINGELDSRGKSLTLNSDAEVNGSYLTNGNTTFIAGSSTQTISGKSTIAFANLHKLVNDSQLKLVAPASVSGRLLLKRGSISTTTIMPIMSSAIDTISIWHSAAIEGAGIKLNGSESQILKCEGSVSVLDIDNTKGVFSTAAQTYPITVTKRLVLTNGVFSIAGNLIDLTSSATITNGNSVPFGTNKMIITNLSFTDRGIRKYLPSSGFKLLMPIGSDSKYTPVTLQVDSHTSAGGNICVTPSDERHISIAQEDADYVLNYYWTVKSENVSGLNGSILFSGLKSDAKGYDDTYQTATLLDNSIDWNIGSGEVAATANNINLTFPLIDASSSAIEGDYLAGRELHLPKKVKSYISVANGTWTKDVIWKAYDGKSSSGPVLKLSDTDLNGCAIYISSNVKVDGNAKRLCRMTIMDKGVLNLGNTKNHLFRNVSGKGRMIVENGSLPSANFENFFGRNGGTIEYAGTGEYTVLSYLTFANNVVFSGSGKRNFRTDDVKLDIFGSFVVEGDQNLIIQTADNKTVRLYGNVAYNSGKIKGTGTILFAGETRQEIRGKQDLDIYNIEIDNSTSVISYININVSGSLALTKGVLKMDNSKMLIDNDVANSLVGGNASSYIEGNLTRKIRSSDNSLFPVGATSRYGWAKVKPVTGSYWSVTYHNVAPAATIDDEVIIGANEYWAVSNETDAKAYITVRWDGQSGVDAWDDKFSLATLEGKWIEVKGAARTGDKTNGSIRTAETYNGNVEKGPRLITFGLTEIPAFTWVGRVDNNWFNADNWSNKQVPTSSSEVTIGAGSDNYPVITDGDDIAMAQSITLQGEDDGSLVPTLTLDKGGRLTVYGNMVFSSALTEQFIINQNSTNMASFIIKGKMVYDDNETIYDGVRVNRTFTTARLWYVGSATIEKDIEPGWNDSPSDVIKRYNLGDEKYYKITDNKFGQGNGAQLISGGTVGLVKNVGSESFDERSITQIGSLYTAAQANVNLKLTDGATYGWNMIINPYSFALDMSNDIFTFMDDKVDPVIWFRRYNKKDGYYFSTYNIATKVGVNMGYTIKHPATDEKDETSTPATTTKENDYTLAPYQAFFVRTTFDDSPKFGFNTSGVDHVKNVTLKSVKNDNVNDVLRLEVTSDEANTDEVALVFRDGGTMEANKLDAKKKFETAKFNLIYNVKGSAANAISVLPALENIGGQMIPLGVQLTSKSTKGVITATNLDVFDSSVQVYLYDNETGDVISLRDEPSYTYTMEPGTKTTDRFELQFEKSEETANNNDPTAVEENKADNSEIIEIRGSNNGNTAIVIVGRALIDESSMVTVYDVSGRIVSQKHISEEKSSVSLGSKSGVYVVEAVAGGKMKRVKLRSSGM